MTKQNMILRLLLHWWLWRFILFRSRRTFRPFIHTYVETCSLWVIGVLTTAAAAAEARNWGDGAVSEATDRPDGRLMCHRRTAAHDAPGFPFIANSCKVRGATFVYKKWVSLNAYEDNLICAREMDELLRNIHASFCSHSSITFYTRGSYDQGYPYPWCGKREEVTEDTKRVC